MYWSRGERLVLQGFVEPWLPNHGHLKVKPIRLIGDEGTAFEHLRVAKREITLVKQLADLAVGVASGLVNEVIVTKRYGVLGSLGIHVDGGFAQANV